MAIDLARLPIPVDREKVAAFCRKWKVRELSLFGSVLRDDFGPESDVDVLVELAPDSEADLFDWVDMIDELRTIFGRDVDLVERTAIENPYRRRHILGTSEVLHAA